MAAPLAVLFHGAPHVGKSQLLCWHIQQQADPDTVPTFEESYEFFEEFQGRRECVTYLDTGGHNSYAKMLEDWVSRTNAQVLVINLEDASSLSYLQSRQQELTRVEVKGRLVVGNLPSGKEANRVVTKDQAAKLFGGQVPYLETNTWTGAGIGAVFSTLMECVHGVRVHTREEKVPSPVDQLSQKDAEIVSLKARQAELEATVAAYSLRVEALEARLSDTSLSHRVEELLLAHLKKVRGSDNETTPVKDSKPLARSINFQQDLFQATH